MSYVSYDCDVAWTALVQCTDIIVESNIDPFFWQENFILRMFIRE